ncbi:hypothetical protein JCM1393_25970 [Clostridium carnis]
MLLRENECFKYEDDELYQRLIVEYQGNFEEEISQIVYACGRVLSDTLAIVFIKPDDISKLISESKTIIYFEFDSVYVLEDVSSIATAYIPQVQESDYLNLNGTGVTVAIMDTGIDYLNEAFLNEKGETRIKYIWDLTIKDNAKEYRNGALYTKDDINNAIEAYKGGKNPYEIVQSKDNNGHGTSMAGIIGGTGIESVAPKCEYIIIKLKQNNMIKKFFNTEENIYNGSDLIRSIEFLLDEKINDGNPLVIFIPLGSTEGSHTGNTIIELYIDRISIKRGLVFVTGTGNQAKIGGHVKGNIEKAEKEKNLELIVGNNQGNLYFDIWAKKPNRISIGVISPAGETTDTISMYNRMGSVIRFLIEETTLEIFYYWPDEFSGDEVIRVVLKNVKFGLWRFRLVGEYILDGEYNAWLPPYNILKNDTVFLSTNPYLTMTLPSMSSYIITNSWYNQANNTISIYSGRGAEVGSATEYLRPLLTIGGTDIRTIGLDKQFVSVSGNSPASAIMAGCAALLFQWGIINGNDPTINAQKMKTYFMRGVRKRLGDTYPNPEWGYGKLDMLSLFQDMW